MTTCHIYLGEICYNTVIINRKNALDKTEAIFVKGEDYANNHRFMEWKYCSL